MLKQTVAGLTGAIRARGAPTAVSAQRPKPGRTMEKKSDVADDKVEKKKAEKKKVAKKKQAKVEKKMEKPAEDKK